MLKALELLGFKSFADKTRFEFPPGITVIVGPNGSGKSNVVDAIKWVLGEQSVKSLRGKEMADVIFNGSGSRRATNTAEITLTLDNAAGLLAIDTPVVHITRRVYRSGEGEYLINRQPSRLRDIRDLLTGTGLGTQAYSVIEQGKVDVLLQSSARDRRVIFEEAAGVSRFKARKLEALRRLERVEQNLLRLSDIVEEVGSRLRSVQLAANKARRYKQYTDRLQELRTQVAQVDWQRLSQRLSSFEEELRALVAQRDAHTAEAETVETRLAETDAAGAELSEAVRQSEGRAAGDRARIAALESGNQHQRARGHELEQEIDRHRRQLAAMNVRAGGLAVELRQTHDELAAAEEQQRQVARRVGEAERALTELIDLSDRLGTENQHHRAAYVEQMRTAAAEGNRISALESQVAAAAAVCERSRTRLAESDGQLAQLDQQLELLQQQRQRLAEAAETCAARLADLQARCADHLQQHQRRQQEAGQQQQRHAALTERIAVLEELEKRHEGLSPGVREVLQQSKAADAGPMGEVRGLVADLLRVSVEAAPLVEVALGPMAEHVVFRPGGRLLDLLQERPYQFSGRVGFVPLETADRPAAGENLEGRPGVLGRADRFIETEPELQGLAQRLLGRTWIVETLAHARTLAEGPGRGQHFVTVAGERLAADGTLSVGPRNAPGGLISRRSELRELRTQKTELDTRLEQAQSALMRLEQLIGQGRQQSEAAAAEHRQAAEALAQHAHKITAAQERRDELGRQRKPLQRELEGASAQHASASAALADARARQKAAEAAVAESEARLAELAQHGEQLHARRQKAVAEATEAKIALAKCEEQVRNLRGRLRQFEESRQERSRAIAESSEALALSQRRFRDAELTVLAGEAEIAELYLRKESFLAETAALVERREATLAQRAELQAELQRLRAKIRKVEEKVHAKELAANEVRHERTTLADRLREDYGIELAELEHDPSAEERHQREEVQREIDELRQKINNLGNVNLESLEEIEQLETRHQTLSDQHKDLSEAKAALERIIEKVNADSRRLFAETLEVVRGHFGQLFRDLFGGGQADIVLEEGVDILESGIEIVARPPGKEPRSISLLSGGEKTLTCVALLLAIFRSRPSPFCVLDEVDAALDEANIDRFTKVLQDFLAWTQFIIVTHSKKTMTCANTIYGVTMQESGISKQVSVRFEDVSDNGEIRAASAASDDEPPELESDAA